MSYTPPDFADDVQRLLQAEGYEAHQLADDDARSEGGNAGFYFTLTRPGWAGIETGPTRDTEAEAWLSALEHRLATSTLDLHPVHDAQAPLPQQPAVGELDITLHYSGRALSDLIETAADNPYGSIRYWCDIVKCESRPANGSADDDTAERFWLAIEADVQDGPVSCDHPEIEAQEIGRFTCDHDMLRAGIRRLLAPGADVSPAIRNDIALLGIDSEHAPDAGTADAVVQFAVFGELVFG
ncbi:hypothetical protein UFOVP703_25 [uncultured Caudovirales phage]|uniref:Uncharacterized protein n=1 Tax=uncultured Caudovirales phage TaxID=2100421 RepID=A0A6J5NHD1_9CAUD|nr:hypothetical protein UFOVP703_25 [uncultured Caudovirales phage]